MKKKKNLFNKINMATRKYYKRKSRGRKSEVENLE